VIEVLSTGALNSIQDAGRHGFLNIGVAQSGAMDSVALALGNILLGNSRDCAGIEVTMFPFRLRLLGDCQFALVGADCRATLAGLSVPPQWVCQGKKGDVLAIETPVHGARIYVCFAGGIDVPLVMGSRSTDLKSGLGGLEGRGLKRGDVLPIGASDNLGFAGGVCGPSSLCEDAMRIRVIPSAEFHEFDDSVTELFFASDWTITPECNRMGIRLSGPTIAPRQKMEMLSHGILPGTVQVPPSGQPIIQMADANTCGGYPKIANVIDADLGRLAQARVGSSFQFVRVDHSDAVTALMEVEAHLNRLKSALSVRLRAS
jgi:biotin-dependent carboxylase-like uncharacterized protein